MTKRQEPKKRIPRKRLEEMSKSIPVGLDPRLVARTVPQVRLRETDSSTPPMLVVNIETGGIRLDRRKEVCPWLARD